MKTVYVFLVLITIGLSATAQSITISGIVADSTNKQPLHFATTTLQANGKAIKTGYTNAGGLFSFTVNTISQLTLSISYVGYQGKNSSIHISSSSPNKIELDTIWLVPQQHTLKEIKIQAAKPLIKQEADRISYDMQADPDSKGSSLLDMMRKVPYLSLSADQDIKLKGSGDFKIFINGKPSGIMTNNPKEILRTMPASTVQRIEVITNPPAKYDAEGQAGIINIVMVKKISNGYHGTANANSSFPNSGPGVGASLAAKAGKLGVSAYGGGGIYRSLQTGYISTRQSAGTLLRQNGTSQSNSRSGYFGTELSYEADSLNLISVQINLNGYHSNASNERMSILTDFNQLLQQYNLYNNGANGNSGVNAQLNYQLGFKTNARRMLTFSYAYSNYNNHQLDYVAYLNPVAGYHQLSDGLVREQTAQIDYTHPVKSIYIEGGIKAILRNNNSNFSIDTAARSNLPEGAGQPGDYHNRQLILAAYNSYKLNLKTWSFSGGVRLEHTLNRVDFMGLPVQQEYTNVVPNLSASKTLKNGINLNFGFSQRIKRPGINRLNPFADRSNPNIVSSGNPNLHPSTINMLQSGINISGKLSANMGVGYAFVHNLDLQISQFDPVTNVTYLTYQNVGRGGGLSLDLSTSYLFTQIISANINAHATYTTLQGTSNGQVLGSKRWSDNVYAGLSFKTGRNWRLSSNMQYNGPQQISLQGFTNAYASISFSANKDIIVNKLSFSATLSNPFQKLRNSITITNGPDFLQTDTRQQYFRSGRISLNYSFGKLKNDIKKAKRGINNDDLSN